MTSTVLVPAAVVQAFSIPGVCVGGEELRAGNINRTYELLFRQPDGRTDTYIFQKINTYVFRHPHAMMRNIQTVTDHIKHKLLARDGSFHRRVLSFLTTRDGLPYVDHPEHGFWRAYEFVDDARAYNLITKPLHFYEAGRAFGEFQGWLADFPATTLTETIPDFHNTAARMETFVQAVQADRAGRAGSVAEEIAFILARRQEAGLLTALLASGEIPYRVTHNDTKINNILFDAKTDRAICVIDLDTVMPGSSLYDFGDAVRSGASTAAEDEEDLSKVSLSLELFEAFTKGFLEGTAGLLTDREVELLPLGAKIMALELASRFLADYLDGDVYFKTRIPAHNLIRARTQIRLVQDIENKMADMAAIVARYHKKG